MLSQIFILNLVNLELSLGATLILFGITIIFSIYINIIIHELGHLIFGLLAGYELSSFRIGSLVFIKYGKKIELKRYNIPGTGGQCLMVPGYDMCNNSFVMYNLGGSIFGLMVSLIVLTTASVVKNPILLFIILEFSLMGIVLNLINIIPMEMSGVYNDGKNALMANRDKDLANDFDSQLRINHRNMQGETYTDMTNLIYTQRKRVEGKDINVINSWFYMAMVQYYMENQQFDKAMEEIDYLLNNKEKLLGIYVNEIKTEKLFINIIEGRKNLDSDYKEISDYIKSAKYMQDKTRVLYAYELLYKNNEKEADKLMKKFNRLKKSNPNKGEIKIEDDMINIINSLYEKNDENILNLV